MTLSGNNITGVLKISGMLDIDSAPSLHEALLDCFLHQPEVMVDLSEVDRCDAAALQVLLAGRLNAALAGKAFRVAAPSEAIAEIAAALGLSIDEPNDSRRQDNSIAE
jgi:anti-anti-sigma factor